MVTPTRVTIALDKESADLFERLKGEERASKSGLMRRALKFYSEYKDLLSKNDEKVKTYIEMLSDGEHIIFDVDHWLLFLKHLETSGEKVAFWEAHRQIAKSHGEQLGGIVSSVEDLLRRLEICNFYKLNKVSEKEFTLILVTEKSKEFIRIFLEEVASGLGFKIEVIEDFSKLRVRVLE